MFRAALPWIFFVTSVVFSALHYGKISPGNNISWITWYFALVLYYFSLKSTKEPKFWTKNTTVLILFTTFIYFLSHLWNYNIAPWNNFGLFDDAAWDIYFAKNHIFNHTPYQAAFFDSVGVISRETLFHYYASTAFKLFGYNLGVFNGSLIVLGFFTVLFTTLLAQEFFSNIIISALVALITNFFPLIFLNVFVGHRYVIALPLMMASYYFLYSGFRLTSHRRVFCGGLFAGLCIESSVMGKQYVMALLGTAALWLIANRKNPVQKFKFSLAWTFISSFFITAAPLFIYIYYAGPLYSIRESSLIHIFVDNFKTHGMQGLQTNYQAFKDVFFAPFTYARRFLPDFLAIPWGYYPLLLVGSVISVVKKRYEIFLISTVILAGAFVAGTADYRILLAGGVWVLAMGFALDESFKFALQKKKSHKRYVALILFFSFIFGLGPSVHYLFGLSHDTKRIFYFSHKDVAVARYIQDVVAGEQKPSVDMKQNEFNRTYTKPNLETDFFFCPETGYAITHLYLQNYNDNKILSFCQKAPYTLFKVDEILKINLNAIKDYVPANNDLQLMWEVSDKITPITDIFRTFAKYGHDEILTGQIEGVDFKIYSLVIERKNLEDFKKELAKKTLPVLN
jgi:hypothetical protein